jgi:hypothetical protein
VAKIIFHERAALGRSEDTEQALLVVNVGLHRTVDDIFAAAGEAQLSVTLTETQVPKRHPTSSGYSLSRHTSGWAARQVW